MASGGMMTGGPGADTFVVRTQDARVIIDDFEDGVDVIALPDTDDRFRDLVLTEFAVGFEVRTSDGAVALRVAVPDGGYTLTRDDFDLG